MFARPAFRSARAVQQSTRRYASTGATSSGPGAAVYVLGALAVGGGGYYYTRNVKGWKSEDVKAKVKDAASDVSAKVKDAASDAKSTVASATSSVAGGSSSSSSESKPPTDSSDADNKAFTGGKQGFISLVLENVETINHNTKKFRFKLPEEDQVSGLAIASAILTKFKGPEMEKPVIRPYTPTSDEDSQGYMDLVIKKYPDGPMSEHLHKMEPGQRLDFKGPIPKYPYKPNSLEHITLIAGGTGITPMWQIARAIFKNPEDKTKVTLVYGNQTEGDILLKKELEELENTYPQRFKAFYAIDKPSKDWPGHGGHVTKELLQTVLPEPKEGDKIKIFVCGPPPMYKAISGGKKSPSDQGELDGMLKELGYSKDQVYKF